MNLRTMVAVLLVLLGLMLWLETSPASAQMSGMGSRSGGQRKSSDEAGRTGAVGMGNRSTMGPVPGGGGPISGTGSIPGGGGGGMSGMPQAGALPRPGMQSGGLTMGAGAGMSGSMGMPGTGSSNAMPGEFGRMPAGSGMSGMGSGSRAGAMTGAAGMAGRPSAMTGAAERPGMPGFGGMPGGTAPGGSSQWPGVGPRDRRDGMSAPGRSGM